MANARKVRCIETGEVYNSCREAEIKLGLSNCAVSKVIRGSRKTAKGYHFEYVEVEPEPEQMYLTTTNEQGETVPVIDSREVARMMGVTHRYLLKCIEGGYGVVGILPTLSLHGIKFDDYYILSSYKQSNNAENRCYLVTKKGCELLGNKQQGEKGILFSLAYVERFNAMEKELKKNNPALSREDDLILAVVKGATPLDRATALQEYTALITDKATAPLKSTIAEQQAELTQSKAELNEKKDFIDDINDCFTFTKVKEYNKQLLRDRKDIVLSTAKLNEVAAELNIPINKIDNPIEYSPYRKVNAYPRKVWMTAYPDIKLPEKESK